MKKRSRKKKYIVAAIVLVLLAAIGLGIGFAVKKTGTNKITENTNGNYLDPKASIADLKAGAVLGSNEESTSGMVTSSGTVLGSELGLEFQVPKTWVVTKKTNEIFLQNNKNIYSVQAYNAANSNKESFKVFLESQSNIRNLAETSFAGHDAFSFQIDGDFKQGFALVQNNKIYYFLGTGIESSPIADTLKFQ